MWDPAPHSHQTQRTASLVLMGRAPHPTVSASLPILCPVSCPSLAAHARQSLAGPVRLEDKQEEAPELRMSLEEGAGAENVLG